MLGDYFSVSACWAMLILMVNMRVKSPLWVKIVCLPACFFLPRFTLCIGVILLYYDKIKIVK